MQTVVQVQLWRGRGGHLGAAARNKKARVLVRLIESIASPCEVCAKPAELGLNENSRENDDNCG